MPVLTTKRRILTFSGLGLAGAALVGMATIPSAMAEERPIDPADAPGIMDRPWPEYPNDTDQHPNIYAGTVILGAEYNSDGIPYWQDDPTDTYSEDLASAVEYYQLEEGLGEHGEMKEEFWGHLDSLQFDTSVETPDWGPRVGPDFYTNGDSGAGVEALQYLLFTQGYFDKEDDVDGQYGGDTTAAVKEFQRDHVCEEVEDEAAAQQCDDGLVGTVTWRALVATG
ncbi:peptidoglycan-binding protein [Spiractinospora alimapuensis]|uniref:peptidoglycan-binding domain-containing protein n=1 Tax=Spiractinospora alimapuensis TaxID=2820884 RepID=UPI001F34E810|nr:peptidoglycan-binding domain-containing protein [Spiractinospora alimapuensis]QVQ51944.1 peptidoglycan-binding protein [Spiractinospora alimapuensis]